MHLLAGNGPAEDFAVRAILGLARLGLEQRVAVAGRPQWIAALERAGVAALPLASPALFAPLARRQAARYVADFAPDVLQAWTGRAARALPDGTVPRVLWLAEPGGGGRSCRGRADYLVTVNESLRRDLVVKGAEPHRCFVIPVLAAGWEDGTPSRGDLGLPESVPLLLVPTLPRKGAFGLTMVFEALALLEGVHLAIPGEPGLGRVRALLRLARACGVADRIHLIPALLEPRRALELADLCLIAQEEAAVPSILEAWASGRPVVAPRRPGITALIEQARNGLLFGPGSALDLAEMLQACLEEPRLAERLIAGGRRSLHEADGPSLGLGGLLRLYHCIRERGGMPRRIAVGPANIALLQNGVRRYLPAVGLGREELTDLLAIQLAAGPTAVGHGDEGAALWAIHKSYRRLVTRKGRDYLVELPSRFDCESMLRVMNQALLDQRSAQYRRFAELQRTAAPLPEERPRKVA